jgi:rhamnulokinase
MVGRVGPQTLDLREVHRFPNEPVTMSDGLHWDIDRLYREIRDGLRLAGRQTPDVLGIGMDAWGCDYGLLDETGDLIAAPFHYRDPRTEAAVAAVDAIIPADRLYARTGMQFLPFNTIYQLVADRTTTRLDTARTMAMIPDLIGYWLTGVVETEETNASTTGLVDPRTRTWASGLAEEVGLPAGILGPIRHPGDPLGALQDAVAVETGLPRTAAVTHVGSHDTASAVVGVPAVDERFAYIACGTWALVGVELEAPILTEASRIARFTNELGVDGRVRYLHNVMGLWLLQETMRTWERAGDPGDLAALLAAAAELPVGGPVIDPDDPAMLAPGDMPRRIAAQLARTDQPAIGSRPALVRCILDSLAIAFARTVREAAELTGRSIEVVHMVGGGSQNALLCQLTADACELPVVAGPVEATAIGNVLVQARAAGRVHGDLATLRALVRAASPLRRFEPRRHVAGATASTSPLRADPNGVDP